MRDTTLGAALTLAALLPLVIGTAACGLTSTSGANTGRELVLQSVGDRALVPARVTHVDSLDDSIFINLDGSGAVLYSNDHGQTWKDFRLQDIGAHDFHFRDGRGGVARTNTGGLVWIDFEAESFMTLDAPAGPWVIHPESKALYVLVQTLHENTISVKDDTVTVTLHRSDDYHSAFPATWETVDLPELPYSDRRFKGSLHVTEGGPLWVASQFGLQRSEDGRSNWQSVPLVPDVVGALSWSGVDVHVSWGGAIFAITAETTFVSHDQGETYDAAPLPAGPSSRDAYLELAQARDGTLYFQRNYPWYAKDDGQSWEPLWAEEDEPAGGYGQVTNVHLAHDGQLFVAARNSGFMVASALGEEWVLFSPFRTPELANSLGLEGYVSRVVPVKDGAELVGLYKASGEPALVRFSQGEWRIHSFPPGANTLGRLQDGTLFLGVLQGLKRSTDDGATWTDPAPFLPEAPLAIAVGNVVELSDRLYAFGTRRADCSARPHFESFDGGQTWSLVAELFTVTEVGRDQPLIPQKVEVYSATPDDLLFGLAKVIQWVPGSTSGTSCQSDWVVPVRSDDLGRSWYTTQTLQEEGIPHLVTPSGAQVQFTRPAGDVDHVLVRSGLAKPWQDVGPLGLADSQVPPDLLLYTNVQNWSLPVVDEDEHLWMAVGGSVFRTTTPVL